MHFILHLSVYFGFYGSSMDLFYGFRYTILIYTVNRFSICILYRLYKQNISFIVYTEFHMRSTVAYIECSIEFVDCNINICIKPLEFTSGSCVRL